MSSNSIALQFRAGTKKRTEGKKGRLLQAIKGYSRPTEAEFRDKEDVIPHEVLEDEELILVYPTSFKEAYDFGRFMQSWDLSFDLHYNAR